MSKYSIYTKVDNALYETAIVTNVNGNDVGYIIKQIIIILFNIDDSDLEILHDKFDENIINGNTFIKIDDNYYQITKNGHCEFNENDFNRIIHQNKINNVNIDDEEDGTLLV